MAVAYFIFYPREVVLDRGREDSGTPEMTERDAPSVEGPYAFGCVLWLHLPFRGFTFCPYND